VFANFLIGLREGLEAALIVSILVAYLTKTGRGDRLPAIWAGVGAAIALSFGFGALLTFTSANMSFEAQELFGGTLSIVAVGLVTWMIFWMRRTARFLKSELQHKLDVALTMGTTALVVTAFLAVGREGLETATFIWTTVRSTGESTAPFAGATLGLVSAAVLGFLFYRGAVRINLSKFFTWTGVGLIVVAAGVLAYGVHDLQEARFLPGLAVKAFDISGIISPSSWYGTLLKGTLNFQPDPTVLQVIVWLCYLIPVMVLFFRPAKPAPKPASSSSMPAGEASRS
jgi:high-affinity iron transporter